jgi:hypothetical protein
MDDDEELPPRSARIEFSYKTSKQADEKLEFTALQEDTTPLLV